MSHVSNDLAAVKGGSDAARIVVVKAWLNSQFEAVGREVPNVEYTHGNINHLYNLAIASQAKSQAATIVAKDFRRKASEYRAQGARVREILESAGMSQDSLPSDVVSSAQVVANVANLLNIRDTELSSFLVAMGDISLRKSEVEEKRAKAQMESNVLLDYTRKAIQKLTYLKKLLAELEDDVVVPCESLMENWKTNMEVMAIKEEQYKKKYKDSEIRWLKRQQDASEMLLKYNPKISHRDLVEMAEHRKELEKMTKPVLDALRSYQDLPPDIALASLAIEEKNRQFEAAERRLEEVLQSALETSDV
ncbi:PREDICTED: AUGMIN subunit 1-like [Camelina sativa]|uniref:AUGMIN subunit 1-like n=1 Tax=Camelina sativa TaxID=90675 RepID=A0ABM0TUB8_CAMSA|nr:PREDICTED: AUGMIN subunit 1-like [Camelina sativa]